MVNATYKVFHKDTGNDRRNICAKNIDSTMSKKYAPLDSPTVYLSTFEEAYKYLETVPELKFNQIENYHLNGAPWPHSPGAMGIWLSNYLAFKKFLEGDKNVLFIFENDAVISPNFSSVVEGYFKHLPDGWDFFTTFVPENCLERYTSSHDIAGGICKVYQDWSCASYAVSRKGAEKTLADVQKHGISAPIDWYVFNISHLNTEVFDAYTLKPSAYKPVWLDPVSKESTIW